MSSKVQSKLSRDQRFYITNINIAREEIGLPRLEIKSRLCLRCRHKFESTAQRLCPNCKNKAPILFLWVVIKRGDLLMTRLVYICRRCKYISPDHTAIGIELEHSWWQFTCPKCESISKILFQKLIEMNRHGAVANDYEFRFEGRWDSE